MPSSLHRMQWDKSLCLADFTKGASCHMRGAFNILMYCLGEERPALRPPATCAALPRDGLPLQRRPGAGNQLQVRAVLRAHGLLHAATRPDTPPGESARRAECFLF